LHDKDLNQYSVVILDEAHERSLNTDILFALVKQAVIRRRGTLRLVITSATLRTDKISSYYFNCPVISVSGRCYPVSILHKESSRDKRMENAVGAAIRIHLNEPAGDVLVFLTGFEECEEANKLCFQKLSEMQEQGKEVPPMILTPLYGA
jgi:ATP-dependent RNA helicase DHX8/PRP22